MQSRWDVPWGSSSRPDSNPNLRIGDAERNEISEQLSKHFSDGRLDAAEFQERLDRAMSAKTRADLSGLLADLPSLQTPDQAAAVRQPPRRRPRVLRVVLFAVVAFWVLSIVGAAARGFWWFGWFGWVHGPWLLIGLIVLLLWARDRRHRRWRYRRELLDERPQ
ncbi:MAG: DUF1707 domain-containing protein [Acidimicrobiales bacterium]